MFNKKLRQQIKETEEQNNLLHKKVDYLAEKLADYENKLEKLNKLIGDYEDFSIEKAIAKKSNEPWAGLSVSEVNKDGQVGLKLDWNDEFINYLKRNGINGQSEDDMMAIWFASLVKEWGEEIDKETAEKIRETRQLRG